ncbi:hypothetical protein BDK51DRAFT_29983 [Blyttiomyces helicus]|uniref:Uncharacterized protein n=1 Tax=Blyttiomyces helicus TaxID=388810 RepID=A0A4P9WKN6_9FUNG|nr:hypothetical protein BDK51DRAFT_29983 [Blyttiomyces helicus]|eukprot:RKO93374.1 hypothetical protein BDK51DRAFT_29983 [Blyttiomyces helicus]
MLSRRYLLMLNEYSPSSAVTTLQYSPPTLIDDSLVVLSYYIVSTLVVVILLSTVLMVVSSNDANDTIYESALGVDWLTKLWTFFARMSSTMCRLQIHTPAYTVLDMTYGCVNMTEELWATKSIGDYVAKLSTNASAKLAEFPDALYDIALAQKRREAYLYGAALAVIGGDFVFIGSKATNGVHGTHVNGTRLCESFYNAGIITANYTVDLKMLPGQSAENCLGPPDMDDSPIEAYITWNPTKMSFFPIGDEAIQGYVACTDSRVFDFSIHNPQSLEAGPITAIAIFGVLEASGVVAYLEVRMETWSTLGYIAAGKGLDGMMWGANQNISVSIDPVTSLPSAAAAVNCTNNLVQATARYLLDTYGTFNITEDTSLRLQYSGGYLLANTRMIDDGRGLQILLVVTLPESDYLGTITATQHRLIGVAAGVAAAMLLMGIALSLLVTLPLRKFDNIMQQACIGEAEEMAGAHAANFDFSALQSGYMDERSFVKEIASMQDVFGTMLRKFADAIQSAL